MLDDFSTSLDYALDDQGELAYLYHVQLRDVARELDAFLARQPSTWYQSMEFSSAQCC